MDHNIDGEDDIGDVDDIHHDGALGGTTSVVENGVKRGRLVDESLACRYLAAQCLVSGPRGVRGSNQVDTVLGTAGEVSRGARAARRIQSLPADKYVLHH
jgi:hypothetical protein